MSRFLTFFALILAFAFAVPALAFDVSVKANVDNAQVFVGDMFNYEIQVTAPENAIVDLPSFVGNLGSFEVKEMKNEKVTEGMPKGSAKFVWQATLNTFVSGDFLIAPQQVQAVVGSDTVKVNTDPVAVKVSMRTTGEETDILEAEDPLDDPRLPQWLFILLIVLGFSAGSSIKSLRRWVRLPGFRPTKRRCSPSRNCARRTIWPKAIRATTLWPSGLSPAAM